MINLNELNRELIGPIDPIGDSHFDTTRRENLRKHVALTDHLMGQIMHLAQYRNSHEASVKAIGEDAVHFLEEIRDAIIQIL